MNFETTGVSVHGNLLLLFSFFTKKNFGLKCEPLV